MRARMLPARRASRTAWVLTAVLATTTAAAQSGTGTPKGWQVDFGEGVSRAADLAVSPRMAAVALSGDAFAVGAFHPRSGAPLWQYDAGAGTAWGVAAAGGRVIAVGIRFATSAGDWSVRALDEESGAILWSDELDRAGYTDAARDVAIAGGRAFVAGGVGTALRFGSEWFVRAYDARTGQVLWQDERATGGDEGASHVIADRDRVWVAGTTAPHGQPDLAVRSYDARTGAMEWARTWQGGDNEYPTGIARLGRRLAVVGAHGNSWFIRVYDARTGRLLWDHVDASAELPAGVIGRARRFVVAGSASNGVEYDLLVRGYDPASGATVWERRIEGIDTTFAGGESVTLRPGAIAGDRRRAVVAATGFKSGSADTFVWAPVFDPATGEESAPFGFQAGADDERAIAVALVRNRLLIAGSRQPLSGGGPAHAVLAGFKVAARR